jgi:hypothetical protein
MVEADAPSSVRYAPRILEAPSWVISENMLTMPNSTMNTRALGHCFDDNEITRFTVRT